MEEIPFFSPPLLDELHQQEKAELLVTATTVAPTNALSLVPMKIFKTQADLDLQMNFLIHHVSPVPASMTESLYDKLKR